MNKINWQKITFLILFVALGVAAMQVPFTNILGSGIKFSLFDFYGPIAGGFLGSLPGLIVVLAMQIINWAWHGFSVETATLLRFLPMLFAVLYFSKKSRLILAVPVLAMIAFWIHPEGRQAWVYAFYWLIPVVMHFAREKFLFARALGATFTAHAVGSVMWLWVFNMKATIWMSLIPIVWKERGLMALGLTLTYLLFNALFKLAAKRSWLKLSFLKINHENITK